MRQDSPVAPLPPGKGPQKIQDPVPEVHRQRQDRAELNDDGIHLPERIAQGQMKQRFDDAQMRGGTDRQELSYAFNDAENDGQEKIVHNEKLKRGKLTAESRKAN